jgi:uncharacterized membrane protein
MLLILVLPTGWAWLSRIVGGPRFDMRTAAVVGLSLLFVFTASGHYLMPDLMADMLPRWVPFRHLLVFATGLLELTIAAALIVPKTRLMAGWAAIAVLILFFPANIYAALNHIPMGGHSWGPSYLLIRTPVQVAIALWAYWFVVRSPVSFPQNEPLQADRQDHWRRARLG